MLVPVEKVPSDTPENRCIKDLFKNANSNEYCNEKGFKQKLIDLLYKLGYYQDNESVFIDPEKEKA